MPGRLRAFPVVGGVLDRVRVQTELARQRLKFRGRGAAQIQPHQDVRLGEQVGQRDGFDGLGLQYTAAPHPASNLGHVLSIAAGRAPWCGETHAEPARPPVHPRGPRRGGG